MTKSPKTTVELSAKTFFIANQLPEISSSPVLQSRKLRYISQTKGSFRREQLVHFHLTILCLYLSNCCYFLLPLYLSRRIKLYKPQSANIMAKGKQFCIQQGGYVCFLRVYPEKLENTKNTSISGKFGCSLDVFERVGLFRLRCGSLNK